MKIPSLNAESFIKSDEFSAKMIRRAEKAALAASALQPITASVYFEEEGPRFTIPLLIPEDIESGDGRSFERNSLTYADLPLPLMWQVHTDDGHDTSYIVGRIDSIERVEQGLGNAQGVFDIGGVFGREALRLVQGGFLRSISADLDTFEGSSEVDQPEPQSEELSEDSEGQPETEKIKSKKIVVSDARVIAATLVAKPAFQECKLIIEQPPVFDDESDYEVPDGLYEETFDDMETEYSALAASAAPVVPPREWFDNPRLSAPTPLTVDDTGRVYGHIAAWHTDHIGLPNATKPPRSRSKYAHFRTGVVRTDDGTDVPVGQITLAGGHAPLQASAKDAVKHYDDTASALIDVAAGEDQYGIWVAGALRPEATPNQVRALRASAPSGDWRPINNTLELVAVCQVNVPGFPIARTMVAGGQMTALVAAGASTLAKLRDSKVDQLEARLFAMEQAELASKAMADLEFMRAEKASLNAEKMQAMAASAAKIREEMAPAFEERNAELAAQAAELRNSFSM
jgi:hypothetical protein